MSATLSSAPTPATAPVQPAALRVCTRCVMDTTDPDITFDAAGVCNHCHDYDQLVRAQVFGGNPFDHGEEYIGTRRQFLRPAGDERRIGPTNRK